MDLTQFLPIRDPALIFTLAMGLILLAPLLAARIRIPAIALMIAAGILVGPHGLGLLARDETMLLFGALGILYIMFVSGLEIDLHLLRKNAAHSAVFGMLTFALPQFIGMAAAAGLLGLGLVPTILLASMFASHTLLTYPQVSLLGLAKGRAATTCIGGTIITNLLAMLILAAVASGAKGELAGGFWIRFAIAMVLYAAVLFFVVPRLARWFFRRFADGGIGDFAFVMAMLFACSWLAGKAGIEPIIGAFMAGIVLNPLIPERGVLMSRITFFGNAFLIPFFLLSVGMLVNLGLLADARAWIVSLVMIAVALVTKLLATEAFGRLFRYSPAERMLIYGMSVNQAAATLAAVVVGFRLGLFDEDIVTGTIMMILVTCFVGSWATDRYGRRTALEQQLPENYDLSSAPQRIMIPMANPENADKLMQLAMLIRRPGNREPIYPLALVEEGASDLEGRIANSEKMLGHAVLHAVAANLPVTPITRVDLNLAGGIVRAMRDFRISTGILGWSGQPGRPHEIFSRTLDNVVSESRQMLLVTRLPYPLATNRRLILALPPLIERHGGLLQVCQTAKTLAARIGASLRLDIVGTSHASLLELVSRLGPDVPTACEDFRDWGEWRSALRTRATPDDLLMIVGVRPGRLAWQPALNRMPATIARELPRHNLIVAYPPLVQDDELDLAERDIVWRSPMRGWHVQTGLDGMDTADAVALMAHALFAGDEPVGARFAERFRTIAEESPLELVPGAVLLHVRTRDLDGHSLTAMGVNRNGFPIPKTSVPPRILILLASPREGNPEIHLHALMEIATLLRIPGVVERICASADAGQAAAIVNELITQKIRKPGAI
jgi:Kef-type K+ transport system membrane component KefB